MHKLLLVVLVLATPTWAQAQDPETGETVPAQAPAQTEPKAEDAASAPPASDSTSSAVAADAAVEPAPDDDRDPASDEEFDTRYPNKKYIDAVLERSSHASLGYALGRQGEGFVVGVRYDQPVTKTNWGRLQFFHYTNFGPFKSPLDPVLMFGVNFITHTKLIMGIFRLYGGGGFHVGFRPSPACKNPFDNSDISRSYVEEGQTPSIVEPTMGSNPLVENRIADIKEKCEDQKDPFGISGGGTGGIEFFSSPMRAYFIEISGGGGTQKSGLWTDSGLILRAGNQFYF